MRSTASFDRAGAVRMIITTGQATEGLKRARRLVRRYWPRRGAAHGFYQPGAFFERLWENRDRPTFVRMIENHCCERVRQRDARMSEAALLRHYRAAWLIAPEGIAA